jgi:hypothetical protein
LFDGKDFNLPSWHKDADLKSGGRPSHRIQLTEQKASPDQDPFAL